MIQQYEAMENTLNNKQKQIKSQQKQCFRFQLKSLCLMIFDLLSLINSSNVFHCRLSGVVTFSVIKHPTNCYIVESTINLESLDSFKLAVQPLMPM